MVLEEETVRGTQRRAERAEGVLDRFRVERRRNGASDPNGFSPRRRLRGRRTAPRGTGSEPDFGVFDVGRRTIRQGSRLACVAARSAGLPLSACQERRIAIKLARGRLGREGPARLRALGEFMRDRRATLGLFDLAEPRINDDTAVRRQGFTRGLAGARIGVDADRREVAPEARLHLATLALRQRRAGRR